MMALVLWTLPDRSGFLVGPCQQMKLMMKPVRRVAAIIYLVMIVVVLSVAIAVRLSPAQARLLHYLMLIHFILVVIIGATPRRTRALLGVRSAPGGNLVRLRSASDSLPCPGLTL